MPDWRCPADHALLFGITVQKSRRAFARAAEDPPKSWRGIYLVTRPTHGRGGVGGASREADFDELPEPFKAAWKARGRPVQLPLPLGDGKEARHARWWKAHVAPALAEPKGSNARGAAVRALAGKSIVGPDGEFFTPSLRDVQRKVRMLDEHGGETGFLKRLRKDKGARKVQLSRPWDQLTADMPEGRRAGLVVAIDRYVKSLWGNGASYAVVRRLSAERLADLCPAAIKVRLRVNQDETHRCAGP